MLKTINLSPTTLYCYLRRVLEPCRYLCTERHILSTNTHAVDTFRSSETPEEEFRVVKVAIIGPPNAGKSTLINNLVERRVCAISSKVHTTRRRLNAITVQGNTQLVILDTPGLVTADEMRRHKLDQSFMCDAEFALLQADIIGVVHDVANHWTRDRLDLKSLRLLQLHSSKHSVLILNKIDALKSKRKLLDLVKVLTKNSLISSKTLNNEERNQLSELTVRNLVRQELAWPHFSEIFMVSALTGSGVGDIKEYLLQQAQPRPWIFKPSQFTDEAPEEVILQTIQARLLEHLPQEIPYNLTLAMEYYEMTPAGTITTVVLVKCPTSRIQKLIVGSKGERIKFIAQEAEQELQNTFRESVRLKLVVTGIK